MVRKIEKQINETIRKKIAENKSQEVRLTVRDSVVFDAEKRVVKVTLWGHLIFEKKIKSKIIELSARGFNTVTTRSRLNALCKEFCDWVHFTSRNGTLTLWNNGSPHAIGDAETVTVDVDTGYVLLPKNRNL